MSLTTFLWTLLLAKAALYKSIYATENNFYKQIFGRENLYNNQAPGLYRVNSQCNFHPLPTNEAFGTNSWDNNKYYRSYSGEGGLVDRQVAHPAFKTSGSANFGAQHLLGTGLENVLNPLHNLNSQRQYASQTIQNNPMAVPQTGQVAAKALNHFGTNLDSTNNLASLNHFNNDLSVTQNRPYGELLGAFSSLNKELSSHSLNQERQLLNPIFDTKGSNFVAHNPSNAGIAGSLANYVVPGGLLSGEVLSSGVAKGITAASNYFGVKNLGGDLTNIQNDGYLHFNGENAGMNSNRLLSFHSISGLNSEKNQADLYHGAYGTQLAGLNENANLHNTGTGQIIGWGSYSSPTPQKLLHQDFLTDTAGLSLIHAL